MFWRVVNIVYGHVISGLYKLFKYDVKTVPFLIMNELNDLRKERTEKSMTNMFSSNEMIMDSLLKFVFKCISWTFSHKCEVCWCCWAPSFSCLERTSNQKSTE